MKHSYKGILVIAFSAVTIMLHAQPAIEWGERYNAPPDMADEALDLAVDAAGNVYVTGSAFNTSGNLDAVTIKYDTSGNQVWVRNFDRGVNDNDLAKSIALDAAGNVYVTGFSTGATSAADVLTVKYDNGGTQQWAMFYDGQHSHMDEGRSISVDAGGNVFVCGYTSDSMYLFDAVTICYNTTGTQQWVQLYDGAAGNNDELLDIVIDGSSNVYVTGNTTDSMYVADILTIKYNSSGTQQWTQTHGTVPNGDFGKAITLDQSGNVIVGAQSGLTGNWFDYLTVKYSNAGTFQWASRYNFGNNKYEDPWEVCTDNAGYVYITGQGQGSTATTDAVTVKYTPAGNEVWVKRFDGGFSNGDDRAYAMTLDDTANVYVAGFSKNASNNDFITVKYDSAGTLEFSLRYNSQYNAIDQINAIEVQNGNIYVTGRSANSANEDYFTIKYSYAAVGISENNSAVQTLVAYPVPATDVLNLILPPDIDSKSHLEIHDVAGRSILLQPVGPMTTSHQINISGLAEGTYTLRLISADGDLISSQLFLKN
jgi:hypothetical protein